MMAAESSGELGGLDSGLPIIYSIFLKDNNSEIIQESSGELGGLDSGLLIIYSNWKNIWVFSSSYKRLLEIH